MTEQCISFQHALKSLVDRVCAALKWEFLCKRDSQGKLVNRQSRPANPGHSTAINLFEKRKNKNQKSREGGTEESNFPWEPPLSEPSLCEGFATTCTPCIPPPKTQEVIETRDVVKVPELAEIVDVAELAPVLEVVKEGVEEVSSEKSRSLNCDAEMTFDHQCEDMNSDSDW